MFVQKSELTKKLQSLQLQPTEVLVIWNVASQTESTVSISEAFGYYTDIDNALQDVEQNYLKLKNEVMLEIDTARNLFWTGWAI